MESEDRSVQKIINDYLTNYGWEHDKCCGTIHSAFRALQEFRQKPGNSLDLAYAAAEHYMFARFMVCSGAVSETQMKALVVAYDAKKWLDSKTGNPNEEAVTANPVSPPSRLVLRWGVSGATVGASDCKRCNARADPPFWRPVEEILGKKTYGSSYGTSTQGT